MKRWLVLTGVLPTIAFLATGLAFRSAEGRLQDPRADTREGRGTGRGRRSDRGPHHDSRKQRHDARVPGQPRDPSGHEARRQDRSEASRSAEVLTWAAREEWA